MIGFVQKNSLFDIGLVTESQTFEGLYQSMLDVIKDKLVRPVLMLKYVMNDTVTEHYLNLQGVTPTALNFTNGIVSVSVNAANTVTVSEVVEAIAEIAEEVAPVKDVKVDGTSVVDSDDVANVTIPVKDVKVDGTSVVDENGDALVVIPNKVMYATIAENEQTSELECSMTFEQIVSAINSGCVVIVNKDNYLYYAYSVETIDNDTTVQFTGTFMNRFGDGSVSGEYVDNFFIHEDNTIDWQTTPIKVVTVAFSDASQAYYIMSPLIAGFNEFSAAVSADYVVEDYTDGLVYSCSSRGANSMSFSNYEVTDAQTGTAQMNVITISRGSNNVIEITKQSFNVGGGGQENWVTVWENPTPANSQSDVDIPNTIVISPTNLLGVRITYHDYTGDTSKITVATFDTTQVSWPYSGNRWVACIGAELYAGDSSPSVYYRNINFFSNIASQPNKIHIDSATKIMTASRWYSNVLIVDKIELNTVS